ncbi:signal peptide, CUB and EGF-like domain-containing protein 1 [Stylophora pistillata]|nr:signal peptide, CUB and EGF-like domain-containing protein 1 [Stylophora pistillata]
MADDQVASNVTTCINAVNFTLKGYIDQNAPKIVQNNATYQINQPSSMEKRSCCGGDIPPPCCAVGSNRVSSTKCGCLPGFHFVAGRSCLPCPADTYQDEQGRTSCKTCPVNTGTFGKTGMTNQGNCTGCAPGFRVAPGFNSSCLRCPSDTYQDEKGQGECKKCPEEKRTFNKTGVSSESHCLEASLIGNYE